MASEEEIRVRLKEFQCQRCNECCRQPGFVYLNLDEEEKIAAFLKMDPYVFVNQYCEIWDRRKLVLKKNRDESCVFLSSSGCSIYEVRPEQCRAFPIQWRTARSFEYCKGIQKITGI